MTLFDLVLLDISSGPHKDTTVTDISDNDLYLLPDI